MCHVFWSILALLFGACVGSFLNVVIFRWPRGLSLGRPLRSFCPACGHTIAWYDNIPVISYLRLHARCRACRAWISLQYPLVELATALVFVMTYDAFFVAGERLGLRELPEDLPMLLAHWVLWAGLIAVSVMDLEEYMVDIRATWIVSAAGIIAHTLWTPWTSRDWIRPGPGLAAISFGATLGLASMAWYFLRQPPEPELPVAEPHPPGLPPPASEPPTPAVPSSDGPAPDASPSDGPAPAATSEPAAQPATEVPMRVGPHWGWLLLPSLLVAAYFVVMLIPSDSPSLERAVEREGFPHELIRQLPPLTEGSWRLLAGAAIAFIGLTLAASHPHAEADADIIESIESEAHAARRSAGRELVTIGPAIVLAVAGAVLVSSQPAVLQGLEDAMAWSPTGDWRPLLGLATGLSGWIVGGAVGWLARIIFTLAFGKEALGMGDVHILAAAGAAAGWPVAFLGFFLASPLTLLAMIVIRMKRQSRALPYGPWLAFGFLLASIFQDRILLYLGVRGIL